MKEIDDLAQELIKLGVGSGIAAEVAVQFVTEKTIEMTAFEWAGVGHTTWLSAYHRTWNRRAEAEEKGKEKAKPAWMPITRQDGEMVGTFAFCPHCGMILSQFDIDGKKIGETSCRNCGTEITWEGYPQAPGTDTRKREKPDDI